MDARVGPSSEAAPGADDLRAFARVPGRYAGSVGERQLLDAARAGVPEGIASRLEGFVAHTDPARWVGVHAGLLLAFGILGLRWPVFAAFATAIVGVSLLGEGTGRFALLRGLFPRSAAYNLVAHLPASGALGALVISAPLDVPTWQTILSRRATFRPMQVLFGAASLLTMILLLRGLAEPWGRPSLSLYVLSLAVLAATAAVGAFAHRTTDGRAAASGATVALEVLRRFAADPPPGLEVYVVFASGSRAFQGGIGHFLDVHRRTLPEATLVLALDDPGRTPLFATRSEGPLVALDHLPTGPALIERLGWAGVRVPLIDHIAPTDARAATLRGLRALALVGGDGPEDEEGERRAAEVVETLAWWFAEDLAGVAEDAAELEGLAEETSVPLPKRRFFAGRPWRRRRDATAEVPKPRSEPPAP